MLGLVPYGAVNKSFVERHPGWTAFIVVASVTGLLYVGSRLLGETHLPPLRERYKRVPREVRWNPRAKRWQAPSGKFVKGPA